MANIPEGIIITGGPPDFPIIKVSGYGIEMTKNPKSESLIGIATDRHQIAWDLFLPDGETRPIQRPAAAVPGQPFRGGRA